jgi:hypothetical protein
MTKTNYGKLTAWLIVAWFAASLLASALHLLQRPPGEPPIPLLLSVLTPIAVFSIWYFRSKEFQEFVLSLNPRTLTMVQAERIGGLVFLAMYTYGILPGMFALPAGWGDIAIGATAYFAATRLAAQQRRRGFIAWQLLGILDLVVAVSMGGASGFIDPQGVTTAPMTVLPLSLIPGFAVPLFIILHIICIAQARRWPTEQPRRIAHATGSVGA